MKKYKYDDKKVIENSTGLIIQVTKSKEEAKNIVGRLNGGCGFAGETPRFFVNSVKQDVTK